MNKPHVWHIREFGALDFGMKHDLGKGFFNFWLNRAAALVAISQSIKNVVLQGLSSNVHVIYNGVISTAELDAMEMVNCPSNDADAQGAVFV